MSMIEPGKRVRNRVWLLGKSRATSRLKYQLKATMVQRLDMLEDIVWFTIRCRIWNTVWYEMRR